MFAQGQRYKRGELHGRYGGQRQGGIASPRRYAMVVLFTGEGGRQFGYRDGWTDEGLFEYTGEGQRGNMQMVRGNAAILSHAAKGKDLHLFEAAGRGFVRYIGQMVCAGFETRDGADVDGRSREVIVFNLMPIDAAASAGQENEGAELGQLWTISMDELRRRAVGETRSGVGRREDKRAVFERSAAIRAYVLRRAAGVCEACEHQAPFTAADGRPYLEPHHIRRLSDGGPDDPVSVAGVCPNCHREAHYGRDRETLNRGLSAKIRQKETNLRPPR